MLIGRIYVAMMLFYVFCVLFFYFFLVCGCARRRCVYILLLLLLFSMVWPVLWFIFYLYMDVFVFILFIFFSIWRVFSGPLMLCKTRLICVFICVIFVSIFFLSFFLFLFFIRCFINPWRLLHPCNVYDLAAWTMTRRCTLLQAGEYCCCLYMLLSY